LAEVTKLKNDLKAKFEAQMAAKDALMEKAMKTKRKMDQANKLINSLADNKVRWIANSNEFKETKRRLVGNVAKASAFISYCGPFNADFRQILSDQYFTNDLKDRGVPYSEEFDISAFLVDQVTIGEWALQKLPTDELSIQNGIMVTRSTRYPLMIDPQGQGLTWIKEREPLMKQYDTVITLNVPNLRESMKMPLENGYPVLIESIENEVDPLLDPVLEKQYITKGGRKKTIILGGGEPLDFDEHFNLYMTSRLANPHFLPELAAKTTIIDFTVTQGGLEQQLLGRLISFEQKSLEDTLNQLQEEVTGNTKMLADLEASLLVRLATAEGSLLDDVELIDVLATIKLKSREVGDKITEAREKTAEIGDKREAFRPVAARGAVLYFCVVEMTQINWMYNTSLEQFLLLFYWSISNSAKAQLVKDRVQNII
jgi:dynein heavy chain